MIMQLKKQQDKCDVEATTSIQDRILIRNTIRDSNNNCIEFLFPL
ncbi:hypothetical protein Gotur_029680 [Gossypium turneri]